MNQRIPLAGVTAIRLRSADCIWAVDRRDPRYCVQLWGQDTPRRAAPPARRVDWVSVEIDSKNPADLHALIGLVERAKRRLPESVRLMRAAVPAGGVPVPAKPLAAVLPPVYPGPACLSPC
jgi:hypothetical protein